ncbi:ciliated left-right organizer metallopeptidase [Centropristis striata]|uniref:ciliated left-right organizer metallopeptidase n=1 Tax=Centropristis striata TaxID=184440 RepID=UPI0027E185FF|nr:ciliated left-right organizer metallopeptidase [Centropristis striata]
MVPPPPQRLWVGMLVVMAMVVVELPGALQRCIYDEVQARAGGVPPNQPRVRAQTRHPGRRSVAPPTPASPQPIRIRTWIVKESKNLSEDEKERLEAAVEDAVRTVSSLLSVNRVIGPLLLSRNINKYCKFLWKNSASANYNRCGRANSSYRNETCLDVTIPDDHLAGCDIYPQAGSPLRIQLRPGGAGLPDTDFLLYLHIQATDKCRAQPDVSAYAVHCQTDAGGRPLAGVVVICRDRLTAATHTHQPAVQTVIHELFHVLGFSKDLFHTWRHCSSTSQVGPGCSLRGRVTHSDGSGLMRIYSPSVTSALQTHLAAAGPELGGPLENLDAAPGGVSSHWESRLLQGSIMAAALGDPTTVRIDPLTLAALQDTGWYTVDLNRAQSLVWGHGEGAMFGSLSTCQNKSSSFFCTGSGFGCHYLHLHKGECQTDEYLEGCRVYKPLKNGSECWKEENSREENRSGEIFGFHSRCFFSNLTRQNQSGFFGSSSSVGGRCYRLRCTGTNRYQLQVSGSDWLDCPAGGAVQIEGFQGLVHCPDRRLCVYADVSPPEHQVTTFPASITSVSQKETWSSLRPPAELTAVPALCVSAAVCLLAAAVASVRTRCSCRVRIHAAPQDHMDL